jgi:hypothetical protein
MIGSVLHALITLMEISFKLIALVIAIPVYAIAWVVAVPFVLVSQGRLPRVGRELGNMVKRLP